MRGARPSSRHCPESGRACALSRRHRHRLREGPLISLEDKAQISAQG